MIYEEPFLRTPFESAHDALMEMSPRELSSMRIGLTTMIMGTDDLSNGNLAAYLLRRRFIPRQAEHTIEVHEDICEHGLFTILYWKTGAYEDHTALYFNALGVIGLFEKPLGRNAQRKAMELLCNQDEAGKL